MTIAIDTDRSTEEILAKQIRDEIRMLRQWSHESRVGGWSTHQVDPMRRRADYLEELLLSLRIAL